MTAKKGTSRSPLPSERGRGRTGDRKGKPKLNEYGLTKQELERENYDLIAKVLELLNVHNLWNDDGTYTFEDGERWARLSTTNETGGDSSTG